MVLSLGKVGRGRSVRVAHKGPHQSHQKRKLPETLTALLRVEPSPSSNPQSGANVEGHEYIRAKVGMGRRLAML
jgi:hypothetical protein